MDWVRKLQILCSLQFECWLRDQTAFSKFQILFLFILCRFNHQNIELDSFSIIFVLRWRLALTKQSIFTRFSCLKMFCFVRRKQCSDSDISHLSSLGTTSKFISTVRFYILFLLRFKSIFWEISQNSKSCPSAFSHFEVARSFWVESANRLLNRN